MSTCNVCGAPIFSDEEVYDQPCLDCIWDGNVKPATERCELFEKMPNGELKCSRYNEYLRITKQADSPDIFCADDEKEN